MANLSALEILVGGMPAPQAAAFRDSHAWPVVLDASAIIDDILYRTGPRPKVSALTIAIIFGVVRPLGKMDVIEEAERRLPAIARSEDRDLAQMRRMLASDYVPGMRLVAHFAEMAMPVRAKWPPWIGVLATPLGGRVSGRRGGSASSPDPHLLSMHGPVVWHGRELR